MKAADQCQQKLLEALQVAVLVVQISDGRILYVNPVVYADLRREPVQILNRHYRQVFTPDFSALYDSIQSGCEAQGEHADIFYWREKRIWEQILSKRITWQDDTPAVLLSITNITDVGRDMYSYQRMAYFDNLLEIPNGIKLEEDISALSNPEKVALVYMEIDRFDSINDLYGFEAGDALLVQVRDWLLETETRDAQVYRVTNGFAILGHNVTKADGVDRAAQICKRFEKPWTVSAADSTSTLYCHANVGVVFSKYVKNEMRNLLMRTSRARKNEAGFAVYDEETDRAAKREMLLRQTLNDCVLQGMAGFSVHYQPIVESNTHRWIGAEALCRWTTPTGEAVPPIVFIPLAEQMGLIETVDNWVRETAMAQCMEWGLHTKEFMLDVNFSPRQEINEVFLNNLMRSLCKTGYPALSLTMEVTESAKMPFTKANVQGLQWLREKGVLLSLDDFGSGYSSFENLIKLPGSYLKTEKLFLESLENDNNRQYLLTVLVGVAHHMGMKIVSEGVETQEQRKMLERFGVDLMQGYLFSRPLATEAFGRELHRFSVRGVSVPCGKAADAV